LGVIYKQLVHLQQLMDSSRYFVRITREDMERAARQMGAGPPFTFPDRGVLDRLRRFWSSQVRRLEPWLSSARPTSRPRRITLPRQPVRRIRLPREDNDWQASAVYMVELINEDRRQHPEESGHAQPLRWHEQVAEVARQHSLDMLRREFMAHVNPDRQTPFDRLGGDRILFLCAGENVALMMTEGGMASIRASLEQIQRGFMNEPPDQRNHRGNILNPAFTHVGIGIAHDGRGRLAVTQEFISCCWAVFRGHYVVFPRFPPHYTTPYSTAIEEACQ
jgi:uncharacterized protein YkwD